jgi:hypothetical protein
LSHNIKCCVASLHPPLGIKHTLMVVAISGTCVLYRYVHPCFSPQIVTDHRCFRDLERWSCTSLPCSITRTFRAAFLLVSMHVRTISQTTQTRKRLVILLQEVAGAGVLWINALVCALLQLMRRSNKQLNPLKPQLGYHLDTWSSRESVSTVRDNYFSRIASQRFFIVY